MDHDPKFTSYVFRAFVKGMGSESCLIVGSAYHNETNAKVERANGVGDVLRAFANGRKDDWDRQLPLALFGCAKLLATAQQDRKAKLDAGQVQYGIQGGPGAAADQGAARRGRHGQATAAVGRTVHRHCLPESQRLHSRAPA